MADNVIAASLQISRTGGLDKLLTSAPTTSLFSYDIKQSTAYSKITTPIMFNEKVDFGKRLSVSFPYTADLLHSVVLHFTLPVVTCPSSSSFVGWTNCIGHALIETVEVTIDETVIDRQTGLFMEVNSQLQVVQAASDVMMGRINDINGLGQDAKTNREIFVPLQFWFNKKISSAIPLVSMGTQTVKIYVNLRSFQDVVTYDGPDQPVQPLGLNLEAIADYYMLGNEIEKQDFLSEPQEFIIEQNQMMTFDVPQGLVTNRFELTGEISSCVKELIWVLIENDSVSNNDYFNFGSRISDKIGTEFITKIGLYLENQPRFSKMIESYYRLVLPLKYHTHASGEKNIYTMPFSHSPENNQPSGTLNFSRYESVELALDFVDQVPACTVNILAVSYNKLTISKPEQLVQVDFMT